MAAAVPESRLKSRLESRLESPMAAKVLIQLQEEEAGKFALADHLEHRNVSGELSQAVRRLLDL